ncbi:HAD family hydrolase [Alteromonas sp. a30]|uniref:HAD family hydrolase n=1 Tax=Alteromonas sp. a30 TaxID=2730917 RepID=UPI002280DB3A|nr:HAD-IA family hydrolase [Alteromonas sp. a30]MCY7294091.1 HAD-IA family hydrolase [Alteromonas sp. a30]
MSIHAVLFDLDGTLLDTADDLGRALNFVLQEKSMPTCHPEHYRTSASHGSKAMLNLGFGEHIERHDFEELKSLFLDFYLNNICHHTCFFPGVEELLYTLTENDIPWGVVTNKPAYLTEKLLPHFDLFKHSKVNISGDTLTKAKPHPEPLLFALKHIKVAPENTLYVGDAERDIKAAKAANMPSVLAAYGYISEQDDTESWQADFIIDNALDVLSTIKHKTTTS